MSLHTLKVFKLSFDNFDVNSDECKYSRVRRNKCEVVDGSYFAKVEDIEYIGYLTQEESNFFLGKWYHSLTFINIDKKTTMNDNYPWSEDYIGTYYYYIEEGHQFKRGMLADIDYGDDEEKEEEEEEL